MADRILVVDDEPGVRSTLAGILEDEGFAVDTAETGEIALEKARQQEFDAFFLDVWLPGIDGLETLKALAAEHEDPLVIMISGHGTIETAVNATKLGAFDFIEKPLSLEKTLLVLRNALRQANLLKVNRRLLRQLKRDLEVVGSSASSLKLKREIEAVTGSESTVILEGESGSGKTMLSRKIHIESSRGEGPFCEVLVSPGLELNAWKRLLLGDPERDVTGRLKLADAGTLYVRNADEMNEAQADFLAEQMSADRSDPINVRLILGVHRLEALASRWRHAEDAVRVSIPPLRDRVEDFDILLQTIVEELSREYAKEPLQFESDALERLRKYPWPGNLRELRSVLERLVLLNKQGKVLAEDLPRELGGKHPFAADLYREFESLTEGVHAFKRFHMHRALVMARGDAKLAAKRLALSEDEIEDLKHLQELQGESKV